LAYPLLAGEADTASRQEFGLSGGLALMVEGWRAYAANANDTDPRLVPLLAKDLTGLPPALIVTAEYDPLRDEGERYAARLADAGLGRVLAANAAARISHPAADVSAMDGYAVRAEDAGRNAVLTVVGESAAGHPWAGTLAPGQAVRIFTGAHVPKGADGIVIQE